MVTRSGYADNWDDFLVKLGGYSRKQRASFIQECTRDSGRIGMIVTLGEQWRTIQSGKRAVVKAAARRRRLVEHVQLIPALAEFRPYVSLEFRATMPEPRVHKTTTVRTRENNKKARYFFRQNTPGVLHGRTVEVIIGRTYRLSAQAWAATYPYGPPPTDEEIRRLRAQFRAHSAPKKKPIGGFDPAGMTPERAIEIAMRVLDRAS